MDRLLAQVKWTRLMWPEDVEPGQYWTHKRTGQGVRVMETDGRYAYVLKPFPPPPRSWRIERAGLVARYRVVQESLRPGLRYPPPPPPREGRKHDAD